MVFQNNFVVSVKCDGKILREFKDNSNFVNLPFGVEYSILLKNLDSRTAVVSISIDGKDILDNSRIIIRGNNSLELKGFKKNNKVTNKFKFIEKTDSISNHRGDRIDDGIIRVEYTFEKPITISTVWYSIQPLYIEYTPPYWFYTYTTGTAQNCNEPVACCYSNTNDNGITVKGSDKVDQSFTKGYTNQLEETSNVITLMLRGYKDNTITGKITKPVTVKTKIKCETCGTKNKYIYKYCTKCGTFLNR